VLRELAARLPAEPPVWLVGGAVRDLLLGRPVQDVDLAVPRGALALARALADRLGAAFVTLDEERDVGRVVWERSGDASDAVRLEIDVAGFRAPDLAGDLRARDLTINALALPLHSLPRHLPVAALVDPAGGLDDLRAGVVRLLAPAVLDDDPLRGLRAVRIAAQLGFTIEPRSLAWIRAAAPRLAEAAPERARDELWKALMAPSPAATLRLADELGLLPVLVPEVVPAHDMAQSPPHREDVWSHTLSVVDRTGALLATLAALARSATSDVSTRSATAIVDEPVADFDPAATAVLARFAEPLRERLAVPLAAGHRVAGHLLLAALFHDLGKPPTRSVGVDGRIHFYGHEATGAQQAEERLTALRFAQAEVQWVARAVRHHMRPLQLQRDEPLGARSLHRFHRGTGDVGPEVCLLALADNLAKGEQRAHGSWASFVARVGELLEAFFLRHAEVVAPPPLVRGGELIAELGLAPGPAIGELLLAITEAQATGAVADRDTALRFAERWVRQHGALPQPERDAE
jgi:poly(A) polymerase/tRNA nucleotidyltransferase (CCA-adding enzyme)